MRTSRATEAGQGTQKATDLLKRQHREVKGLFRSGSRERRRLLERIGQSLKIHTAIEETSPHFRAV